MRSPEQVTLAPSRQSLAPAGTAVSVTPLLREFLSWVTFHPRTYADVMEAWQSHCPRFTIWEDALGADLVRLERSDGRFGEARVTVTPRGRAVLTGC